MAPSSAMWEMAHMPSEEETPFQSFVAAAVALLPSTRNFYDRQLQTRLKTSGKPLYDVARKAYRPKRETLKAMAEVLGQPLELLDRALDGEAVSPIAASRALSEDAVPGQPPIHSPNAGEFDQVDIQHIDLAYGLGSTFTDSPVDIEALKFPRVWVETITMSPPALLTWTRGRGDSMLPTIDDGDLILLDRSQRKVTEQDALWAFTVGDTGSIKRLRVKGDRYQILSDNPSVPPDEEPIDFVNIVARVVFIGRRT